MYQKILAKLVTKYPGLSKAFLGSIATHMATKTTEESGIDDAITALDNAPISIETLASEFQKEGDRRVSEAAKKQSPKSDDSKDDSKPDPKKDDVPEWAKGLMAEVQSLRKEKAQTGIAAQLAERLKGKVPPNFYKKATLPEKDEDLEAFAAEIESDYAAFKQDLTNEGFSQVEPPIAGVPVITGVKSKAADKGVIAQIDRHFAKGAPKKAE